MSVEEIDREIEKKKAELQNIVGTECEVYTRIVGYYRALKNWNPGKREEYRHRVLFDGEVPEPHQSAVLSLSEPADRRSTFIPEKATLSDVVAGFQPLQVG